MDLASNMVEMAQGKFQVELGAKVAKASDEMLGTLIDTFA
jgi:flagellar basal body rod protein FlgG